MAGGSLCASTFQTADNPVDAIESTFFKGAQLFPSTTESASPLPTLGHPQEEVASPLHRRIPASFTNWQTEKNSHISSDVTTSSSDEKVYETIIPEPGVDPLQALESEMQSAPWQPMESYPGMQTVLPLELHEPSPDFRGKQQFLIGQRPFRKFLRRRFQADYGLGYERIAFAPVILDTPLTSPYMGIRIRSDRGMNAPDRLEYVWGKAGNGPAPESRLDLVDTIFRTELGSEKAGFISEMRMRALDPHVNGNTVGFGDMLVGGKALVYDSACTKVSTIFLTHLNTGPEKKGLGRGHVALEPGVLAMRKWSEKTYLFGEWKYHVPLGATSGFAGDVLRTGWGMATIWHDTDRYAMLPTFEIQTHTFLFGGRTLPDGTEASVDGSTAVDLYPGIRWSFSETSFGACELGMAGGVSFADRQWFDSRMMIELRWLR